MKDKAVWTLGAAAVVLGGLTLSLPSCSLKPGWNVDTWQAGDDPEDLPRPTHIKKNEDLGGRVLGQTVEIDHQAVAGVPIEGSFVKRIRSESGLRWLRTRHLKAEQLPSETSVKQGLSAKAEVAHRSELLERRLACRFKGDLKPFLRFRGTWYLLFDRNCEQPDGQVQKITLTERGEVVHRETLGASFSWERLPISLFPRGPKRSQLQALELGVSAQPFYLSTPALEVVSDAGFKFADLKALQSTTPNDDAFDMVQAYYYASEAAKWVNERYGFQISALKIRTHVGFPERSNVAFFYGHEIRLGTGDGVVFNKMPWDPSIVIHETMHAVVSALTGLPFQGQGGSVQEALADILTALQLNNPNMGEAAYKKAPFQRTLESTFTLREKNGGLYHDSLIVSGMLWRVRQDAGQDVAEKLTGHLLSRLAPDSDLNTVGREVRNWLSSGCTTECQTVSQILSQRGWP